MEPRVVIILSVTSDIGTALAKRYSDDGYAVVGTYRSEKDEDINCHLYHCDISSKASIVQFAFGFRKLGLRWDTLILCPCNPLPLKAFFDSEFNEWSDSVHINAIEQLRVLHELYPYRNKDANVVFFAGPGANNAVINFSAYTISKIMLIKMCEFLDAENEDLNIFAVGPGWVKTKNHYQILANVDRADPKYQQTLDFLASSRGTSMDDIYKCIQWLSEQGKEVAGGRNFSVVNDKWRWGSDTQLVGALKADTNMYKLRRHKNDLLPLGFFPP